MSACIHCPPARVWLQILLNFLIKELAAAINIHINERKSKRSLTLQDKMLRIERSFTFNFNLVACVGSYSIDEKRIHSQFVWQENNNHIKFLTQLTADGKFTIIACQFVWWDWWVLRDKLVACCVRGGWLWLLSYENVGPPGISCPPNVGMWRYGRVEMLENGNVVLLRCGDLW